MKDIISCSRRTDIPAFYYDKLQGWLKDKSITCVNPYYPEKEYVVDLSPEQIHSIVLWSKDFSKVADNPGYLSLYNLFFQYTITLYGSYIEPKVPTFNQTCKTLEKLINQYNSRQFNIRFDPIFFADFITSTYNSRLLLFHKLCRTLNDLGYDKSTITTSYISMYGPVKKRLGNTELEMIDCSQEDKIKFFEELWLISRSYGYDLYACANDDLTNIAGIKKAHCIDKDILTELFGKCTTSKDSGQRKSCGCVKSKDIGGYLTCNHGCVYCYANPLID